jgi:phospholipase C
MPARIQHVVVLMLENRSFDHFFGFDGKGNGLSGSESNWLDPSSPGSASNHSFQVGADAPFAITKGQGPGHSLNAANWQLCNSKSGPSAGFPAGNNGFARNYRDELIHDHVGSPSFDDIAVVMKSFGRIQLPSMNALADQFCLCDNWYSEVPGPTQPNRLYIHMGTSAGYAHNVWSHPFDNRTIYNSLQDAGKTWAVYAFDSNEVRHLTRVAAQTANFKDFADMFASDARAGNLPNYSFIIPRFYNADQPANDQHAPHDVRYGDSLIADAYDALRSNDASWAQTVFIVTYDENGGFYDHVVPPDGVPNPDGINSPPPGDRGSWVPAFAFDRLGFRVPAIIASPWVAKGIVDSTRYQHTSVLATLRDLFNLGDPLTQRDASATSFAPLFNSLDAPRTDTPATLPRAILPTITVSRDDPRHPANQPLDATQQEMLEGVVGLSKRLNVAAAVNIESLPTTQGDAARYIRDCYASQTALYQMKGPQTTSGLRDAAVPQRTVQAAAPGTAINFIPNDPLVTNPGVRTQNSRADRPDGSAKFNFLSPADPAPPQQAYNWKTQLRPFLYWQCREAALAAVETWETLVGPLTAWSPNAANPLEVDMDHEDPRFTDGYKLNAFYDRAGLRFFIYENNGQSWASGISTDTVSHETGHALLDTLRPDFWGSLKPEVPAFHESFADCWAMLTGLSDPPIRTAVAGVLSAPNLLEANSEYLSDAIKRTFGNVAASLPRHALNQFKWQLPSTLPPGDFTDLPSVLSVEAHSFSRVFTGCFYDTLTGIYRAGASQNADSLWQAARTAAKLLIAAVQSVPESSRLFRDLGRQMVIADQQLNAGQNRDIIGKAFDNHGIPLGSNATLFPEAVLDGPPPKVARQTVSLAPSTVKDLRKRLQAGSGERFVVSLLNMGGHQVAEAKHVREIPLDQVDRRLKGVVAYAVEPVIVGGSGKRAALFGMLPEREKTEDEVQTYVESLVQNGRIQFQQPSSARTAVARATTSSAGVPIPTHVVRQPARRGGGQKPTLERVRFLC